MSKEKLKDMDIYLAEHPLERRALEGALEFGEIDSFEELLAEIDDEIQSRVLPAGDKIDTILEPNKAQEPIKNNDKPKFLALIKYAITVAAAVLMIVILRSEFGGRSTTDFSQYIDTYPDVITNVVRGNEQEVEQSNLVEAMTAYNSGDMLKANELLEIERQNQMENNNVKLYLAISDLHLGNFEKSLLQLEELSYSGFAYEDGAIWYRAICLLQLKRQEDAKELLSTIANQRHYKSEEAQKILHALQ